METRKKEYLCLLLFKGNILQWFVGTGTVTEALIEGKYYSWAWKLTISFFSEWQIIFTCCNSWRDGKIFYVILYSSNLSFSDHHWLYSMKRMSCQDIERFCCNNSSLYFPFPEDRTQAGAGIDFTLVFSLFVFLSWSYDSEKLGRFHIEILESIESLQTMQCERRINSGLDFHIISPVTYFLFMEKSDSFFTSVFMD